MDSSARSKFNFPSGAPQSAQDENVAKKHKTSLSSSKARNSLTHGVAKHTERLVRDFWENRGEEGKTLKLEAKHMRFLFRKTKHRVPQDIWMPGPSQPGEEQTVEAVVSEVFVLEQLKEVIELRETWLRQNGLPTNFQMRDQLEGKDFLEWAKAEYHAEDYQLRRQQEDFEDGGETKVKSGKTSRWDHDLQCRLGTSALWQMVLDGN